MRPRLESRSCLLRIDMGIPAVSSQCFESRHSEAVDSPGGLSGPRARPTLTFQAQSNPLNHERPMIC